MKRRKDEMEHKARVTQTKMAVARFACSRLWKDDIMV
jgi:hypothetical protein